MALWGKGDPRWIVEEREDSTNTNNWHWTEKNVTKNSEKLWKEELLALNINNGDVGNIKIKETTKCEGDVILSNRKGKVINYFELIIECKWEAKLVSETDDDQKASGTLKIPNISEENDADDIEVEVSLNKNTKYGQTCKTAVRKQGLKLIQAIYTLFREKLKTDFCQGMILPTKKSDPTKMDGNAKAAAKVSVDKAKQERHADVANPKTTKPESKKSEPKKQESKPAGNASKDGVKIETCTVNAKSDFKCSPDDLYLVLTNQDRTSAFTRSQAKVNGIANGDYSIFDGFITGKFLDLTRPTQIKMEWRQKDWPEGHFSTVTIDLKSGDGCTVLSLAQTGVPKQKKSETEIGWTQKYFSPIKMTFGFQSFLI